MWIPHFFSEKTLASSPGVTPQLAAAAQAAANFAAVNHTVDIQAQQARLGKRGFLSPMMVYLWLTNKKLWKMAIEIVDFPIKNGDFQC